MSWIHDLYNTYEQNIQLVGVEENQRDVPLLPICHTTQKAQVEIILDGAGNFLGAEVVSKDDARTLIPCTEKSGGRTSGEAPHPLCDKLQYVAKDFEVFATGKKPYYASFVAQLKDWGASEYSHPKVSAILAYVQRGTVIQDLITSKVLILDDRGLLMAAWDKAKYPTKPAIFEVLPNQHNAFVRWQVQSLDPDDLEPRVWRDPSLWERWTGYYFSTVQDESLCYVLGEEKIPASQHLGKLRNDGDRAKLISSNDAFGLTYRGRFTDSDQAATTSIEATQKAHLALRWLISRKGFRWGDLAVVAWTPVGKPVPQPLDDTLSCIIGDLVGEDLPDADAVQAVAGKFNKRLADYSTSLGDFTDVIVLALDSATTGRLAITYYRKMKSLEFLRRVENWHRTCAWQHTYGRIFYDDPETGKRKARQVLFTGAPAPKDIAEAAYGPWVVDRLVSATVTRLLPCIIDGMPIPRDLVQSAVRQACNRISLKSADDRFENQWNKTLSIACALYRKYKIQENFTTALDPERTTRDYLYGRLLAVADNIESWALSVAIENRTTNAARLMQRFAQHPYSTWRLLDRALNPFLARLKDKGGAAREKLLEELIAAFSPEDFTNDKPLSGEFLLGFHSQRAALKKPKPKTGQPKRLNNHQQGE